MSTTNILVLLITSWVSCAGWAGFTDLTMPMNHYLPFQATKSKNHESWTNERNRREEEIQKYFRRQNNDFQTTDFEAVVNGSNGRGPVPMILFRVFPKIFPEIWGSEDQGFIPAGLTPNPYENATPHVPFGMALSGESYDVPIANNGIAKMKLVGFTCVACHAGQVRVGDRLQYMIGAPSNRVDNLFFKVAQTSQLPQFNIEAFRAAIQTIPAEEFVNPKSGFTMADRDLILNATTGNGEKIVGDIKNQGARILGAFAKYLRPTIYPDAIANKPQALEKKRGPHDAFMATIFAYLLDLVGQLQPADGSPPKITPEEFALKLAVGLPSTPAEVDAPSMWNQGHRGPYTHWDGTLIGLLHRNVGAASATHNKPVKIDNMVQVTRFIQDLPSAPYPFAVNMRRAKKGQRLFEQNCKACHSGNTQIIDYKSVGTDAERVKHLATPTRVFLGHLLNVVCPTSGPTLDTRCLKADGSKFKHDELVMTQATGYISDRLDGVWARAPYLHNGSVPTLRHLLVPRERPVTFYRGSFNYDRRNVGFTWQSDEGDSILDYVDTVLYDTRLVGYSNKGHDTAEYLGIDWGAYENRDKLQNLIEYLKTL